jgi:hypothetical protein
MTASSPKISKRFLLFLFILTFSGARRAQDSGSAARLTCIAHRGVGLSRLPFGAIAGAIFDFSNLFFLFIVLVALCDDTKKRGLLWLGPDLRDNAHTTMDLDVN